MAKEEGSGRAVVSGWGGGEEVLMVFLLLVVGRCIYGVKGVG